MKINKKCICGAHWKASGIPQDIAREFLLEWEANHNTCGKKAKPLIVLDFSKD